MENIHSGIVRAGMTGGMSLEDIARNPAIPQEKKESEALRQFEGILLREVLRDTVESMVSAGADGNRTATGVYSQWMTDQLVDSITSGGGLGIARTVGEALRLRETSSTGGVRDDALPKTHE